MTNKATEMPPARAPSNIYRVLLQAPPPKSVDHPAEAIMTMGSTGRKVEMASWTRVHAGAAAGSGCLNSDPLPNGVSTYWSNGVSTYRTSHDDCRYLALKMRSIFMRSMAISSLCEAKRSLGEG